MFQGPKGYIGQICEVHLQYGNSTTKWPFYTFFPVKSSLYILFSMPAGNQRGKANILEIFKISTYGSTFFPPN